jgi:hypothetical protein
MNAPQAKNPSLKLKFGSAKASPGAPSPAGTPGADRNTPGVIVHDEALERQRQMVAAGMNGGRPLSASGVAAGPRNPFGGASRSGSDSTPNPALNAQVSAASPPAHMNGVKSEMHPGQSPALSAIRPSSAASGPMAHMHPAQGGASRIPSGSPHPPLQPSLYPTNNNYHHQPPQYHPPNGFLDTKRRPAGQSMLSPLFC